MIYGDTLAICVFYSFVEKVIGKDRVGELCHTQNGCVNRENLAQYVKFRNKFKIFGPKGDCPWQADAAA